MRTTLPEATCFTQRDCFAPSSCTKTTYLPSREIAASRALPVAVNRVTLKDAGLAEFVSGSTCPVGLENFVERRNAAPVNRTAPSIPAAIAHGIGLRWSA